MFFNHPGWIEANADHVRTALGQLGARVAMSTSPSRPTRSRLAMAQACRYEDQLRESADSWRRPWE